MRDLNFARRLTYISGTHLTVTIHDVVFQLDVGHILRKCDARKFLLWYTNTTPTL